MRIIRDYQFVSPDDRGATVAIGNFDGVHIGHRAVIDMARKAAPDAPLGIVTFEPHPREYFAPDAPPFRLMNAEAKANRLEKLGVRRLYELNFNAALSNLSAEEFAQEVIVKGLGLTHVVIGADFCFGKGRAGNAQQLQAFGQQMGFGVTVAPLIETGDKLVSSTNIRQALSDGKPREAAQMLSHLHRIEGKVITGEQRGRELGYPTANQNTGGLHQPKFGVYAIRVLPLLGCARCLARTPRIAKPISLISRAIYTATISLSPWSNTCAARRNLTALRRLSPRWMPIARRPVPSWRRNERPN